MSYSKTQWINGEDGHQTPINASNLNKIEEGISDNSSNIDALQGGMRFKGEISSLPPQKEPKIGDVYQASVANISSLHNKEGDLLVYTGNPGNVWHVIPSGDEHDGTVTEITQGAGIIVNNGSSLTKTGEIKLDTSYVASDIRNGLMSNEHFHKLSTLSNVAVTGSWLDLNQSTIPISARRQIRADLDTESVEDPTQTVVSQYGLKSLFAEKSDTGHTHLIEEISGADRTEGTINPLSYYLAKENDGIEDQLVEAAPKQHTHGNITTGGYLQKLDANENRVYAQNTFLVTDNDGKITNTDTISSSVIRGYTFKSADGTGEISLSTLNSTVGSTENDGLRGSVKNLVSWIGTSENSNSKKLGARVSNLEGWIGTSANTSSQNLIQRINAINSYVNKLSTAVVNANVGVTGSESENTPINSVDISIAAGSTASGRRRPSARPGPGAALSAPLYPSAARSKAPRRCDTAGPHARRG